ncbi:MAG: porin [Planctomycetaceae bacterium]|nr:porin [Planctomycetaceae bacterium]
MKNIFFNKTNVTCLGIATAVVILFFVNANANAGIFDRFRFNDPCQPVCFEGCETEEEVDPCDAVCVKKSKSSWGLYTVFQMGVFANEFGQTDNYNAMSPISIQGQHNILSGNTLALINTRQSSVQVNQLVIGGGRNIDSRRGWDFGVHFDFAFGTDAILLQSAGLEFAAGHGGKRVGTYAGDGSWGSGDYYSALGQIYFEAGYKNFNLKVGKFLSPLGSNSPVSPYRFFYTLPSAAGLYPATQSGVLATWTVNKRLTIFGGWTNGIDTTDALLRGATFDSSDNGGFIGGFNYQINKRINLKYAAIIGSDERVNLGLDNDYFIQSFIVGVNLGKRWDYKFEWTLNNIDGANNHLGAYGINQELTYKYSDKLTFGGRAEYTYYIGAGGAGQGRIATGLLNGDEGHTNLSLGVSWAVTKYLTLKPEIRYDKFDSDIFNNGQSNHQFSGGLSFIVVL